MNNPESDIQQVVGPMVRETYSLLGETIRHIRTEDERRKQAKSDAPRHRLLVLLDALEQTEKILPRGAVNPWFIAELKGTLDVIRKWKTEQMWKKIEPSLVNSSTFTHTIAMLQLAEHLRREGHSVELIPTATSPTPDLRIQAVGGTQEWFRAEFYQPSILDGFRGDLTEEQIDRIVQKIRKKASAQIGDEMGVMVICGYNQSMANKSRLRKAIEKWMQRSSRVNLAGVILEVLGVLFRERAATKSFQPTITVEFVPNPHYFGSVGISDKSVGNLSNLISEPLRDINTVEILKGNYASVEGQGVSQATIKQTKLTVEKRLATLGEVGDDMTVIVAKVEKLQFFFRGKGNIDYVCGKCGRLLADKTWELSLSNMILKCPDCESLNLVPLMAEPKNPKFKRIGIAEGRYEMESPVELKLGVQLVGVKMGKERLHQMIGQANKQESGDANFNSIPRKTSLNTAENPNPGDRFEPSDS